MASGGELDVPQLESQRNLVCFLTLRLLLSAEDWQRFTEEKCGRNIEGNEALIVLLWSLFDQRH